MRSKSSTIDGFAPSPLKLSWSRVWNASKRAAANIISSDASLRCAGVAFYSFLSLFPAIAAAMILFGLFADQGIVNSMISSAAPLIPQGPEDILREQLNSLEEKPAQGLGVGLVLTLGFALWSGSRGTNALIYALTRAYRENRERDFVKGVMISLGLTLGAFIFAAITIFAIALIPLITSLLPLPSNFETLSLWLRWPVIALLVFVATVMLYRVAPVRASAKIRWIVPGALLASVLWLIASYGFSIYVENFSSYDATFGSLSAVVVLLLWMYYSAMIFVLGASINAELELETIKDTTTGSPRPAGERGAFVADNVSDKL